MNNVYRTQAIGIKINISDFEEPEHKITLKIEYKSPSDSVWQTEYLTEPVFTLYSFFSTSAILQEAPRPLKK